MRPAACLAATPREKRTDSRCLPRIRVLARILLGLLFVVFGLNILFPFIPMPKEAPPKLAADFAGAMMQSHYFLVVGALQFIGGALLLAGFVPLGLLVLCPILVNIVLFHVFLNPGCQMAIVVSVLAAFLLWAHRDRFAPAMKRVGSSE